MVKVECVSKKTEAIEWKDGVPFIHPSIILHHLPSAGLLGMVQLEDSIVFLQLRAAVWLKKAGTVRWFNQEWSQNTWTTSLGGEIGSERSRRLSGQIWITAFWLSCLCKFGIPELFYGRYVLLSRCWVFLPSPTCAAVANCICTVLCCISLIMVPKIATSHLPSLIKQMQKHAVIQVYKLSYAHVR